MSRDSASRRMEITAPTSMHGKEEREEGEKMGFGNARWRGRLEGFCFVLIIRKGKEKMVVEDMAKKHWCGIQSFLHRRFEKKVGMG